MLKNVISCIYNVVLHELASLKMGGRNDEIGAMLQEIDQEMFSKTFLHTIVDQQTTGTTPTSVPGPSW